MRRELLALHKRLGITTIFVTHDQEEAMTICDRIAVMDAGVVQQVGTPIELFDRPANRFVAQFVGSVNLIEGEMRGGVFASPTVGEWDLPISIERPPGANVELAFRPHAVSLSPGRSMARADHLALDGRIEGAEFLGEFVRYDVRVGDLRVTADLPHARNSGRLAVWTEVGLAIPASEVRLIAR
jgi:iron(III) transport system ATP-binding protein